MLASLNRSDLQKAGRGGAGLDAHAPLNVFLPIGRACHRSTRPVHIFVVIDACCATLAYWMRIKNPVLMYKVVGDDHTSSV